MFILLSLFTCAYKFGFGIPRYIKASVNPKAATCDELQSRRKRLHTGLCKLVLEDICLKAVEQNLEAVEENLEEGNLVLIRITFK